MTMCATCGHDISDGEFVQLAIMDYHHGSNVVSFGTYCPKCANAMEGWGIVLHNEDEEKAWRKGELSYPEMTR